MKRRQLMAASLAAPLAAHPFLQAWAQAAAPGSGFDPALIQTQPQQAIDAWLDTGKATGLAGLSKVCVSQFRILFATQGVGSAMAGGGIGSSGSAHIHGRYVLTGVDDALMQSLTNDAYQRFLQSLGGRGLTVVPYAELPAAARERFEKDAVASPAEVKRTVSRGSSKEYKLFSAQGLPLYFAPSDPLRAHMGMGVALSGLGWDALDYVESGVAGPQQMALLRVTLVMDFIQMETSGGLFANTATVGGEPGIQLTAESSLRVMPPQGLEEKPKPGGGTVWATPSFAFDKLPVIPLKQTLQPPNSGLIGVVDATDAGVAAVQTALAVVGFLSGMGGSRKDKRFEVKVDTAQYQSAAQATLGAVVDAWAGQLAAKPQ